MSTSLKTLNERNLKYPTWQAFKTDLELNLWCHLSNDIWLQIKPKRALPWDESDMRTTIAAIIEKQEFPE
jgi:hypothetical protein